MKMPKPLRSALEPPGSRDQFDWMSSYAGEPLNSLGP